MPATVELPDLRPSEPQCEKLLWCEQYPVTPRPTNPRCKAEKAAPGLVGLYAARVADRADVLRLVMAANHGGILPGHPGYALPRSVRHPAIIRTIYPIGRGTPEHEAHTAPLHQPLARPEPQRLPRRSGLPRVGWSHTNVLHGGRRRLVTAGMALTAFALGATSLL